MRDTALIEVCTVDELAAGQPTVVAVPHSAVAIFHVGERMYGIDDVCMRCGRSLASGKLAGTRVCCPQCGWSYDVVTGVVNGAAALHATVYEVSVRDTCVFVAIPLDVSRGDS